MKIKKTATFTPDQVREALELAHPHLRGKRCNVTVNDGKYDGTTEVYATWVEEEIHDVIYKDEAAKPIERPKKGWFR